MALKSGVLLDHVVLLLLLPYRDVVSPPEWMTTRFTIMALELIAFVHDHPEKRKDYWWDMPYGIVDLALTTCEPSDLLALQRRLAALGSRVSYATTREGGQVTLGRQELKWRVTFIPDLTKTAVPDGTFDNNRPEDIAGRSVHLLPNAAEKSSHYW
ncbi:hypothetical protein D0864_06466 [Hortaea werneckii]|uniref:Uncharacterized protein n=1 Tax=Hortaea werneckii TaxID=91943 RepID=A0A3M7FKI1_HORWE|nr:hypothetical protein D0864_06466 [Hortaea werneckii]